MATPKLFATTILAATALAISAPASADWQSKQVAHDDLDLSTVKGQERLKNRVKQAVKMICGSPRAVTLKEKIDIRRCQNDALAQAMPSAERAIAAYMQNRQLASLGNMAVIKN